MAVSVVRTVKSVGTLSTVGEKTYTGDSVTAHSFTVATGVTDQQRTVTVDITELQYFVLMSDQDILAQFNNATTGVPDISLLANVPFEELLAADQYHVSLFTADITDIYFTNTSGSTANIKIVVCQNNTP